MGVELTDISEKKAKKLLMTTITAENHSSTIAALENGSQESIKANLEGLKKIEIRSILKSIKEKLHPENGTIEVVGIKKNALILAGYQEVVVLDSGAIKGAVPKEVKTVTLDLTENNDKKINPDSLLKEEDKVKPETDKYDCGVSLGKKRAACKGCTCGLAEELEDEAKNKIKENIDAGKTKPSCGSCYLGDAFRCASCPFAGMPAFEKGAPPKLANADDFNTADI